MKKQVKFWSVLAMVLLLSSFAAAVEKTALPQAGTSDQVVIGTQTAATGEKTAVQSDQLIIGSQDAVTAQDAGGGYMSSRDIILVVVIILAVIGLAAIL
jgi:hypothetical protein